MFPEFACDDVFRLETRRMWLRWPRAADAAVLGALVGERAVAEMTGRIPHPYPPGEAARYIEAAREKNAGGREIDLVLAMKDRPGEAVGGVGLRADRAGAPMLGYWVGRPFQGRGLATEAAQAVIDFAFTFADLPEIGASARVVNPASRRVLEKCGFAYLGSSLEHLPARGGMSPCDRFRLDRKVWSSLKSWRMPGLARQRDPAGEAAGCPA
jgi:RimJ/RimL family protein N-acetyltransferase